MKIQLLIFSLLLILSAQASAQFFQGPTSSALGNAGRAAIDGGEAPFLNPASLASLGQYYASIYYGMDNFESQSEASTWGAALIDGTSGAIIPGAFSYVRRSTDFDGGGSVTQQDFQLTLAETFREGLGIGVALHRLSSEFSPMAGGDEFVQYNGHFGLIWAAAPNLGFGLSIHDFVPASHSVPGGVRVVPVYGFGVNYMYERFFSVRFDLTKLDRGSRDRWDAGLGLETSLFSYVFARLGTQLQETSDRNWLTAGLAYKGPRLSLEYSFQKDMRSGNDDRHLIDLWLSL